MPPRLQTISRFSSSIFPFILLSSRKEYASPCFSTTVASWHAAGKEPTYYEILGVSATASAIEIKKRFYALSMIHHPDRNPSDPDASSYFASIASAYHVLSNSANRARYDRDHGIVANNNTHNSAHPGQHPMGGGSQKGSYVGSRPASGLSKRRGTFRGPPPSFYAHGGYGATRWDRPGSPSASTSEQCGNSPSEENPTSFVDRNPVSHFNARGHFRTQSAEDARRRERKSKAAAASAAFMDDEGRGKDSGDRPMLRFLIVCLILIGAGAVTGLIQGDRGDNRAARKTGKQIK